jgi:hypothetical protein
MALRYLLRSKGSTLLRCSAICAALILSPQVAANEFSINLSLDYGDADDKLSIDGASTSFGFGALIPQLVWTNETFGAFGVGYGYGYGPNQTATLGPVSGRGDLESDVIQFSYNNQFALTDRLSLMVLYENRQYEVSGDLDGAFGERTAPIAVTSDIEFEEIGARLAYSVNDKLRVFAGVSTLDWSIDSYAKASVGESITAEVSVEGGDDTIQYSLGADTVAWDWPLRVELRSADLEADETINKLELRFTTTLFQF